MIPPKLFKLQTIGILQRIKGNKFDVKYSLFKNMLYPDCNELDPSFIIQTIYQYRYQNPTQYPHLYTNQTYVDNEVVQIADY